MSTRRSAAVTLGITALVAGGLTACGSTAERNYAGYCVDKQTQQRVPDSECRSGRSGRSWYYVRSGTSYPRVGGRATGGSATAPKDYSYVEGGLDAKGGTTDAKSVKGGTVHSVTKGGFGGLGSKGGS